MAPINICFEENETTKDRLIKATQALIATMGYDSMTTRMIAKVAGVSLSAISFHFENKEILTREAVKKAAEDLKEAFSPLTEEIKDCLAQNPVDKELAWTLIDRFLASRMYRSMREDISWINIGIAEHENGFPESSRGIMSKVAVEEGEELLARLILAVSDAPDIKKAMIISRSINAAMMSYLEKPLILNHLAESLGTEVGDASETADLLHDFSMEAIRSAVVNPMNVYKV